MQKGNSSLQLKLLNIGATIAGYSNNYKELLAMT